MGNGDHFVGTAEQDLMLTDDGTAANGVNTDFMGGTLLAALMAVVHDDASVDDALALIGGGA